MADVPFRHADNALMKAFYPGGRRGIRDATNSLRKREMIEPAEQVPRPYRIPGVHPRTAPRSNPPRRVPGLFKGLMRRA